MVYEYLSVVHFTLVKRPYNSISVRQWLFLIEFHYICIVYFCQTCGIIFIQLFFLHLLIGKQLGLYGIMTNSYQM